jgi:hypothetical protein
MKNIKFALNLTERDVQSQVRPEIRAQELRVLDMMLQKHQGKSVKGRLRKKKGSQYAVSNFE